MMKMMMTMMMAMRILFARTVMVIICLAGVDFTDLDHHLQFVEVKEQGALKSLSCAAQKLFLINKLVQISF